MVSLTTDCLTIKYQSKAASCYCMRSHHGVADVGKDASPWENRGLETALDHSDATSRPAPSSASAIDSAWRGSDSAATARTLVLASTSAGEEASVTTDGRGCDNNDTDMRRTQLTAGAGAMREPTSNGAGRTGGDADTDTDTGAGETVTALAPEFEPLATRSGVFTTSGEDKGNAKADDADMRPIQLTAGVGAILAPTGNGAGKCNGNVLSPLSLPDR